MEQTYRWIYDTQKRATKADLSSPPREAKEDEGRRQASITNVAPWRLPLEMSISTASSGAPANVFSAGDELASRRSAIAFGSCPWLVFVPELP